MRKNFSNIVATVAMAGIVIGAILTQSTGLAQEIHSRQVKKHTWVDGNPENIPNDGVLKITAGDQGHYIIDTRYELCFFTNMNGLVQVPCEVLKQ